MKIFTILALSLTIISCSPPPEPQLQLAKLSSVEHTNNSKVYIVKPAANGSLYKCPVPLNETGINILDDSKLYNLETECILYYVN